eukprot:1159718-Pelagomonas_calceolata.AAC.9
MRDIGWDKHPAAQQIRNLSLGQGLNGTQWAVHMLLGKVELGKVAIWHLRGQGGLGTRCITGWMHRRAYTEVSRVHAPLCCHRYVVHHYVVREYAALPHDPEPQETRRNLHTNFWQVYAFQVAGPQEASILEMVAINRIGKHERHKCFATSWGPYVQQHMRMHS